MSRKRKLRYGVVDSESSRPLFLTEVVLASYGHRTFRPRLE